MSDGRHFERDFQITILFYIQLKFTEKNVLEILNTKAYKLEEIG